jgi:signal transduction histidine kinase
MPKKKIRQKYFIAKELRLSIALIILWSLLVTAFFTYFAKELSGRIGHGTLLFVIIMGGYGLIVIVLTMLFSHRLIGPFQRLKAEIRIIIAGDYCRRLTLRGNDDIYIRSFIHEINKLLDEMEKMHNYREDVNRRIDSQFMRLISEVETGHATKEQTRESILSMHKELQSLSEKGN